MQYEDAIECFDKALEIDPKYAYAWVDKGKALDNLGKYKNAIECFDKALEIDPNSDIVKNNLKIAREKLE
ncbi:MAG: tetratricopeptide repeat protein [Methanosarcinales archaeon]